MKNEEYINIEKTVQEIVKIQEYSAKQKRIALTTSFTNIENMQIYTDKKRFQQVLINL